MKKRAKPARALITKPNLRAPIQSGGSLVQVILDVDLRNGHDGLLELGRKKGVDWARIQPGQYVAFVNRQLNRFMLLGVSPSRRGAIIIYYKSYAGRIDRQEIETLPQAFGINRRITAPAAVNEQIDAEVEFKRARRVGPDPVKRIGG